MRTGSGVRTRTERSITELRIEPELDLRLTPVPGLGSPD